MKSLAYSTSTVYYCMFIIIVSSKSTVYSGCTIKYSQRGGVTWQMQHELKSGAVFASRHYTCEGEMSPTNL